MAFAQHIGATGQQDISTGDESFISCVEFTIYGFTGSLIPQTKQELDGPGPFSPNYFNCAYVNADTGTLYSAGTAITSDGRYIADTTGAYLSFNVTDAGDGDFWVVGKPFLGPAPSFGGGGGGGTVTGTDADNAANSITKLPVIPGTANATAPTWTEGHEVPASMDLSGNQRVITAAGSKVGGNTVTIKPTVTVTAAAYSAGNCVGGLITLTSAMRTSGGSGALSLFEIADHANQSAQLTVLIFDSAPAGTFTDHAAFPTMSAADNAKVIASFIVTPSDYSTVGGTAYARIPLLSAAVVAAGSANLYMAMNTSGTPTYAATTDLKVAVGIFQD